MLLALYKTKLSSIPGISLPKTTSLQDEAT